MSFVNRFSKKIYGGIAFTGNTLGVSKKEKEQLAGTHHSIGAFITTDNTLSFQDFGSQTTNDYRKNRSNAILRLPDNVNILYAELIWGGRSKIIYEGVEYSVKERVDDDILFWIPESDHPRKITPSVKTRFDKGFSHSEEGLFFIRSAEVTEYIKNYTEGEYGVGCVPTVLFAKDSYAFCGWTLAVIYECMEPMDYRQVSLYVGSEIVEYKNKDVTLCLEDIKIPKEYQNIAKLSFSAAMGGYHTIGSEVYFGSNSNSNRKKALLGPNNLAHHFFSGQINDLEGNLERSGTFGMKNHRLVTDSMEYVPTVGARGGWDITTIDVSNNVTPLDDTAEITFHTEGASYLVNAVGIDIDAVDTNISIKKEVSSHYVKEGEDITVTLTISNEGSHTVRDVYVTDFYPELMSIKDEGITITNRKHGISKHKSEINFMLGELTPIHLGGLSVVVSYILRADTVKNFTRFKSSSTVHYYSMELEVEKYANSNPITFLKDNDGFHVRMEVLKGNDSNEDNETENVYIKETIQNISGLTISNLVVLHSLTGKASYDKNVKIDGKELSLDISSGIIIEELESGKLCVIEYKLFPYKNSRDSILNEVEVTGIYKDNTEGYVAQFRAKAKKDLKPSIPNLEIEKISDKILIGKPGDRINFTLTVSNTGNVSVHNIIVTDKIQAGMSYVKNSTRINQGVSFHANPEQGIRIGDLESEGSCVITYQAALLN